VESASFHSLIVDLTPKTGKHQQDSHVYLRIRSVVVLAINSLCGSYYGLFCTAANGPIRQSKPGIYHQAGDISSYVTVWRDRVQYSISERPVSGLTERITGNWTRVVRRAQNHKIVSHPIVRFMIRLMDRWVCGSNWVS
jgi:hypothetical protein